MTNLTTSASTTNPLPSLSALKAENAPVNHPEFFRMPKTGGDPWWGLSRSHYYELERTGKLKLIRLRREGATRGVVLIPYAAVRAIVEAAASEN